MKPQPQPQPELKLESKVVRFRTDSYNYHKFMRVPPKSHPEVSGEHSYPGIEGLYGEWLAVNKAEGRNEAKWSEGKIWFVSATRGYPQTEKLFLSKAFLIAKLRVIYGKRSL